MENGFITLSEALKIFNLRDAKGMFVPFDIEYRTFNESKPNKVVNLKFIMVLNIFQKQKRPKKKQQEKHQTITKQNKKHRIVKRRNKKLY